MKITLKSKIIRIGNSNGIIIPKSYFDSQELKLNDIIVVNLFKIREYQHRYQWRCHACNTLFNTDKDDDLECPVCEETFNIIKLNEMEVKDE